jgi:hypothetical protein
MQFFHEPLHCNPCQKIHDLLNLSVGPVWEFCRRCKKTVPPPTGSNASIPLFSGPFLSFDL